MSSARERAVTASESVTQCEVDVVVVGSGGAGLAVAITAHDQGSRILILDQRVRDRVVVADLQADHPTPDWVEGADSIDGLTAAIGVDQDGMSATIARWNKQVAYEADEDFGPGTVWFEAWTSGGLSAKLLAPVNASPYDAMRLYGGALGPADGLDTDKYGPIKRFRTGTLHRLYAAGNAAASVYGLGYRAAEPQLARH